MVINAMKETGEAGMETQGGPEGTSGQRTGSVCMTHGGRNEEVLSGGTSVVQGKQGQGRARGHGRAWRLDLILESRVEALVRWGRVVGRREQIWALQSVHLGSLSRGAWQWSGWMRSSTGDAWHAGWPSVSSLGARATLVHVFRLQMCVEQVQTRCQACVGGTCVLGALRRCRWEGSGTWHTLTVLHSVWQWAVSALPWC